VNIFSATIYWHYCLPQNRRYAPGSGPTGRSPALPPWATALNRCAIVAVRLGWGALTRSEIVDSDARGPVLKIDASSTSFKIVVTHEYRCRHLVAPCRQRRNRCMKRPSTCAAADGRSMRVSALPTMRFATRYQALCDGTEALFYPIVELNQPLTAVTNSINAVRRRLAKNGSDASGATASVMGEAAEHALRAGKILRQIRDFVTRGDVEMRIEDVAKLIEEASTLAVMGVSSPRVAHRFDFDPGVTHVLADRIQIQQVLVNLIRNAVEAMADSADRELVVLTRLLDVETVEIAVADRGPGIGKDRLEHLFEPFQSTNRDGMGLGLSICRSIVEAHGGRLRCGENPGGGAIFRFTVSAAPADGESGAE
jgi:K+-sensing histidine kinase KdpD